MKIKAGLLIDLGNSETRMKLLVGGNEKTIELSNRFVELPAQYTIPKEYQNNKTSIICVKGSYYAHGSLAEREFSDKLIRPSAVEYKTDQLVSELSLTMVFLNALINLSEARGLPISDIDASFNVSILLPPLEHDVATKEMKELVKSFKSIKALLPFEVDATIEIDNVNVLPEGVTAFFGVYYTEHEGALVEVDENQEYSTGYVLVLDIGAGTTDVVLIRDTELVLNSKDSFNKGGNTVESNLKTEIRRNYKYAPQNVTSIIATGILEEGTVSHKVEELVTVSKEAYSKILIPDLMGYLERMTISLKEVKGVLVVGGGSLPTIRDGQIVSPAMSDVLIKYLKNLAPNLKVMSTSDINPRLLNIEGLKFIHKYA